MLSRWKLATRSATTLGPCAESSACLKLWRALKGAKTDGLKFRKQHPIGPYVLDFYYHEASLCVEVDGASHGFGRRPENDARRDAWLKARGVRTLRLSAAVVLNEVDDAVRMIVATARGSGSGF